MSTTIAEGALTFTFAADAEASKYDDWSFYRNQFQQGCFTDNKAVDLLCELNRSAWLIEVKDYRAHARTKAVDLADEVAIKVRDTLAGLVAASVGANDPVERAFARRMVRAQRMRVVCHIEQPAKASRLRPRVIEPDKLKLKLRTLLKAIDAHPIVMDRSGTAATLPWVVS
ncbi:hypothetical protein [Thauera sp.]|uniref:hypothetical protein n=1 Tax=Thauera sp. TaxID=1905334 RepID=UPI002BB88977|nr:hypothetical protein [Thauera sp.]HRP25530.1 hypothetical protein [Thauera sp.]